MQRLKAIPRDAKIRICPIDYMNSVAVIIECNIGGKDFYLKAEFQPVELMLGSTLEPAMHVSRTQVEDMLKSFKELNIETESDSELKGKLMATERHLDDLRHLMKLPKVENKPRR